MKKILGAVGFAMVLSACGGGDAPTAEVGGKRSAAALQTGLSAAAAQPVQAVPVDTTELLFDFAESTYPTLFPGHKTTQSSPPYKFRYYPETGMYVGVVVAPGSVYVQNGVYVMGGEFGPVPTYVGLVSKFVTPPPYFEVSFNPGAVTASGYAGELDPITVKAQLSGRNGAGTVYPRLSDPSGVFAPNPPMTYSYGPLEATLFVNTTTPGTHRGSLELRLCKDLPCTAEYPGSPVLLPYTVTLQAAKNLTTLTPIAGVSEWAMHQGNMAHTGYVPATFDAGKFNRRWRWTSPAGNDSSTSLSPAVTQSGRVIFTRSGYFATSDLLALNESDGTSAWSFSFGAVFAANPPAAADGKVFVATSGHEDTFMWSFNAASGLQQWKTPFSSQWEHYLAPTIDGTSVFTNGGYYGGLLSFKFGDGVRNWFAGLPQYDGWTPALDGSHAYAFVDSSLYKIDKLTGTTVATIPDPETSWHGYDMAGAPLLGTAGRVITISNGSQFKRLVAFNTTTSDIAWSVSGRFSLTPALAKGIVYVANGTQVEARRENDGSLAWAWTPPENTTTPFQETKFNIIVTNNLLFVSTSATVYAVDIASRKTVWTYPTAGQLALSPKGVLYIVSRAQSGFGTITRPAAVTAINLR